MLSGFASSPQFLEIRHAGSQLCENRFSSDRCRIHTTYSIITAATRKTTISYCHDDEDEDDEHDDDDEDDEDNEDDEDDDDDDDDEDDDDHHDYLY